jgi:hypothetical protein
MEQIGKELTRELIETVRREARRARRTLKPLMKQITSLTGAAGYLPDAGVPRECGVSEAAALLYGTEVFLTQYRRLLEKIGFSVYREDVAAMMQMIREIERRVDEVVDKVHVCIK